MDRLAGSGGIPSLPPFRGPEPAAHPRHLRPVALVGLLALVIAVGTVLLTRPTDPGPAPVAVNPPATIPAEPDPPVETPSAEPPPSPSLSPSSPSPTPSRSSAPAPHPPRPPLLDDARFELLTGVTELNVATADLGNEEFKISDNGLDVDSSLREGVLRVSAKTSSSGSGSGSDRLNVQLNDRIEWHLRMSAGVHLATFDMSTGTVSRVDLDGGAQQIDVALGRLTETVPIRMTGGVHTWRITTARKVPVRVEVGSGAGNVAVYGKDEGGVGAGVTIRSGDLDDHAGLDIDAQAGMHSLEISRD